MTSLRGGICRRSNLKRDTDGEIICMKKYFEIIQSLFGFFRMILFAVHSERTEVSQPKQTMRGVLRPFFSSFVILSFLSIVCCLLSGCIRVSGTAGYYGKGAEGEAPKAKQVGFDTQNVVNKFKTPGTIEIAE